MIPAVREPVRATGRRPHTGRQGKRKQQRAQIEEHGKGGARRRGGGGGRPARRGQARPKTGARPSPQERPGKGEDRRRGQAQAERPGKISVRSRRDEGRSQATVSPTGLSARASTERCRGLHEFTSNDFHLLDSRP